MVKIQKFNTSTGEVHYIVIPKEILEEKGWGVGDDIRYKNYNGRIYLSKKG